MATGSKQNDAAMMADLMKAMKLLQKAKENNVDLSTSNESLLPGKLAKVKEDKTLTEITGGKSRGSCFSTLRWTLYILLWILGIVYLVALNHRETLCQMLD